MKENITYTFYLSASIFLLFLSACKTSTPKTFEDYQTARQQLVARDQQLSFSYEVQLSAKEQQLDEQMRNIQQQWLERYQSEHFFPPARNFYLSKTHIESHPLFQLLQRMPKGGALHIHAAAIGQADWIIEKAKQLPEMHVYWSTTTDKYTKGQLYAFAADQVPDGFQSVAKLAAKQADFGQEMRALLTFDQSIDRDSVDIWQEFELIFQRIYGFISYEKVYADYITHGLQLLAADQVQHAELRSTSFGQLYTIDYTPTAIDIEASVKVLEQIERNMQAIDPDFTFNIIYAGLRFKNRAAIWEEIETIYEFRKRHPKWMRGFDLVAEEDAGNTTLFHAPLFLKLDSMERADQLDLPLYLHDGESNWASSNNLYDAVLLGTKRIGHGLNLFRFPSLLEAVKEKDICLEINPLSNQILGYIRDLRNHPASTYLRRGINCSISSDDPLILDYAGLSYDYWSIYMAWELGLADLKQLSRNGLLYAAVTEEERAKALAVWEARWAVFVEEALGDF
ncbi:MAG: hypothetical protein AAF847_08245 [Bacteroidota bacterium]